MSFEAVVLMVAFILVVRPRMRFLLFRNGLAGFRYRVGYWIQSEVLAGEPLKDVLAESLKEHGIEAIALQEQAAADLYRNTRWRDRIGWHAGRPVDLVVVGRLREKATRDIGNPYAWVLDLRFFYPKNGAQLSAPQLQTFTVVTAGAVREIAAKTAGESIKALWLMKTRPAPPTPKYPYDTSSWPFTLSLDLSPTAPERIPQA